AERCARMEWGTGALRAQDLGRPSRTLADVEHAPMESMGPRLPELDPLRLDPESAPVGRPRPRGRKARGELAEARGQLVVSAAQLRALLGRPGAHLRIARARGPVGVGLFVAHLRGAAL